MSDLFLFFFFFSSRRRHTRFDCDWSSDVCSSDLRKFLLQCIRALQGGKEPPHVIRTKAQNDLRHVACIATKIPINQDPKQFVTDQLKKERYWESVAE